MLLVYVDDAIICGPSSKVIDEIIASLKEDYDVRDEGEIDDYLGVNVIPGEFKVFHRHHS
jgi:uncharacterized protein YeeX (DUF496 family)